MRITRAELVEATDRATRVISADEAPRYEVESGSVVGIRVGGRVYPLASFRHWDVAPEQAQPTKGKR